jgi:sulfite exporter TauE/SafE
MAIPWIAFVAGLGGSLHCVGMCGGLVTACTSTRKSVVGYQIGRLFGYALLGLLAGLFGQFFNYQLFHPLMGILPAVTIGLVLIWWGVAAFKGRKAEVPLPNLFNKVYQKAWTSVVPKLGPEAKATGVGFFSIFLPCGLLYAIVLTVAAFQNPLKGAMALAFFWLGTVPAMGLAPELMKKVIGNLFGKRPKIAGMSFILIGLVTISWRVVSYYQQGEVCQ